MKTNVVLFALMLAATCAATAQSDTLEWTVLHSICRQNSPFAYHHAFIDITITFTRQLSYENHSTAHFTFSGHNDWHNSIQISSHNQRQQALLHHPARKTLSLSC